MWRYPEWWSVALSIAAWIAILSMPRHSPSHQSTATNLMLWLLMVVAMMFPLVIAQVRQAAFHSLWSRRHRAIGLFLTGYVVTWLAFGALVIFIQGQLAIDARASAIVAILIAVAWQAVALETPRARQLSSDHAARTARMARELGLPEVWVAHRHGVRVRVLGVDDGVCRQRSQHPGPCASQRWWRFTIALARTGSR